MYLHIKSPTQVTMWKTDLQDQGLQQGDYQASCVMAHTVLVKPVCLSTSWDALPMALSYPPLLQGASQDSFINQVVLLCALQNSVLIPNSAFTRIYQNDLFFCSTFPPDYKHFGGRICILFIIVSRWPTLEIKKANSDGQSLFSQ